MGLIRAEFQATQEDEIFRKRAQDFTKLAFHILNPHTVALLLLDKRGRSSRLETIESRAARVLKRGDKVTFSSSPLRTIWSDQEGVWIRELSASRTSIVPLYRDEVDVRALRLVPFSMGRQEALVLAIDYLDPPERDPFGEIEPLFRLFTGSLTPSFIHGYIRKEETRFPITVFLKRTLIPFIEYGHRFFQIRSLELLLWGGPIVGGDVLQLTGRIGGDLPGRRGCSFQLGPLDLRWSFDSPKELPTQKTKRDQVRYFPLTMRDEIVGNVSIETENPMGRNNLGDTFVKIIGWSLENEMKLLGDLGSDRLRSDGSMSNPYRSVIRVLDEWANASRYKEYMSLGIVRLNLDGLDPHRERGKEKERVERRIGIEVEGVLRKGDLLIHSSGGELALLFPRTSPFGADNALRRLRNQLEGKRIYLNGSAVKIRHADYDVLCYPTDFPTEEAVLERCSEFFLSS